MLALSVRRSLHSLVEKCEKNFLFKQCCTRIQATDPKIVTSVCFMTQNAGDDVSELFNFVKLRKDCTVRFASHGSRLPIDAFTAAEVITDIANFLKVLGAKVARRLLCRCRRARLSRRRCLLKQRLLLILIISLHKIVYNLFGSL